MAITAPPPPASPESAPPPSTPTRLRPLGRRRHLPGSRAVVGGLLVTLAALATFVAHSSATAEPTATVVVADRPIAAGDPVSANDLRTVAADLPAGVLATLFTAPADLDGAIALTPLEPDQAVARTAVRPRGSGDAGPTHDLSFPLERERALSGRIQPGERVDLVATFGAGSDARTEIVVRGVRVVAVDAPPTSSAAASAKVTITLAFASEDDVLRAANALEVAKVTISRSSGGGATHPDPAGGTEGRARSDAPAPPTSARSTASTPSSTPGAPPPPTTAASTPASDPTAAPDAATTDTSTP